MISAAEHEVRARLQISRANRRITAVVREMLGSTAIVFGSALLNPALSDASLAGYGGWKDRSSTYCKMAAIVQDKAKGAAQAAQKVMPHFVRVSVPCAAISCHLSAPRMLLTCMTR